MAAHDKLHTPTARTVRWVLAGIGFVLLGAAVAQIGQDGPAASGDTAGRRATPTALDPAGAEVRCTEALELVTAQLHWPVRCRWRQPGDTVQGQSFPPPKGLPPFDDPHVEIYVDPTQDRAELAHVIAHELGHMHHTRDPGFLPEWLAARGLPPDTRDDVWTEDYAEVFAALFSPPSDKWRAPTNRPDGAALARLKTRFFSDA